MSRAQIRKQWRSHFRCVNPRQSVAAHDPGSMLRRPPGPSSTVAGRPLELSTLRIHVEQLELRGVGRIDEQRVAATLQSELRDLLATRGVPSCWGRNQVLDHAEAGPSSGAVRVNASWLGVQLARTIYNLRRPARQ